MGPAVVVAISPSLFLNWKPATGYIAAALENLVNAPGVVQ